MFPNSKHRRNGEKTTYDQSMLMNISIISKWHPVRCPIHVLSLCNIWRSEQKHITNEALKFKWPLQQNNTTAMR